MKTKEQLEQKIQECEKALLAAKSELQEFIDSPENNVFPTLEKALKELKERLFNQAKEDCEGSYNCGAEQYNQEFIVDGVHYMATLDVEYNRHDKTYYYVERHYSKFSYKKL